MTPSQAREFLATAAGLAIGREGLDHIYGRDTATIIIAKPRNGDDESTVAIAETLRSELHRRYPALF